MKNFNKLFIIILIIFITSQNVLALTKATPIDIVCRRIGYKENITEEYVFQNIKDNKECCKYTVDEQRCIETYQAGFKTFDTVTGFWFLSLFLLIISIFYLSVGKKFVKKEKLAKILKILSILIICLVAVALLLFFFYMGAVD